MVVQSSKRARGFTLLELAIVMLVFALLAGAVLAGSELVTNARTRSLIGGVEQVRGAYFGFLDRYRALPGDYAFALRDIPGVTVQGNGNGRIEASGGGTDEPIAAWEHLARAGFLDGGYRYAAGAETPSSAPKSPFGAFPRIEYGSHFAGASAGAARHNLNTGNLVPAPILAEADRKIDDGLATSGGFRFSTVTTASTAPNPADCYETAPANGGSWRVTPAPSLNCGGTWLLN